MQLPQSHKPYTAAQNIGAFEARRKFGQLIEEAYYKKDAFVVERSGRPMAVIMSVDEYQQWKKYAKDQLFASIEEVWKRNQDVPTEVLDKEVELATEMLHAENKRNQLHQK